MLCYQGQLCLKLNLLCCYASFSDMFLFFYLPYDAIIFTVHSLTYVVSDFKIHINHSFHTYFAL